VYLADNAAHCTAGPLRFLDIDIFVHGLVHHLVHGLVHGLVHDLVHDLSHLDLV
jgi:hypothetical protein